MSEGTTFVNRDKGIRYNAEKAVSVITGDPLMTVTIKPYRKSKTQEQLGYLWAGVLPAIVQHIEDSTGEHYTTDDVYSWMVEQFADDRVVTIGGKPKVLKVSASKMNITEISGFIDRVVTFAAMELDLVIPEAM